MIGIYLPVADERILSALTLQNSKDFRVYMTSSPEDDYPFEPVRGSWSQVQEPFVAILTPGAIPPPDYVKRVGRSLKWHPDFDVYHVDVAGSRRFPRKVSAKKLFSLALAGDAPAPLSSFVFRADVLRAKAVFKADGTLDPLPCVFSCAAEKPIRRVCRGQIEWQAEAPSQDPLGQEKAVRERLDLLRWTEGFFGDDDYPLSVGDQLDLFAGEVIKLFPSYSEDDLKEIMLGFQVSQGPIRRMRALSALSRALKERQKQLQ